MKEGGGSKKQRAFGKWKDGGEKSKRSSDGGVEFDSEQERGKRGESVVAKEKEGISVFQRISLSQSLTHYVHSSLSAGP